MVPSPAQDLKVFEVKTFSPTIYRSRYSFFATFQSRRSTETEKFGEDRHLAMRANRQRHPNSDFFNSFFRQVD
jgi:hypothetical protein